MALAAAEIVVAARAQGGPDGERRLWRREGRLCEHIMFAQADVLAVFVHRFLNASSRIAKGKLCVCKSLDAGLFYLASLLAVPPRDEAVVECGGGGQHGCVALFLFVGLCLCALQTANARLCVSRNLMTWRR